MKLEHRQNQYGDYFVFQTDVMPERLIARFGGIEEAEDFIGRKMRLHAKEHPQAPIPPDDHPAIKTRKPGRPKKTA